jgi:hypothetical protein
MLDEAAVGGPGLHATRRAVPEGLAAGAVKTQLEKLEQREAQARGSAGAERCGRGRRVLTPSRAPARTAMRAAAQIAPSW